MSKTRRSPTTVLYEYSYDAHGRLRIENDYTTKKQHIYEYGDTGNISNHITYKINDNGSVSSTPLKEKGSTYVEDGEGDWPDQLVSYNGKLIHYDNVGNPIEYLEKYTFSWSRGRQLAGIKYGVADDTESEATENYDVEYEYNQKGLRTYKETADTITTYEWDENTLIRETVTYVATNKTYDVWYLYDSNNDVIGFEYSFINDTNEKSTTRIYYERDLQGNVIGLLDSRGAEIVKYSYDAWGNITDSLCYEGYEIPYSLNHITYRGYYRDNETGFYYLQSRYYDPEICRFINADDTEYLGFSGTIWGYNLYSYCENNPVNNTDPSGYAMINVVLAAIFGIVGWYFGDWLAYKLVGKKNTSYWILRSAIAIGGAAIGWYAGTLITKFVINYLSANQSVVFSLINKLGSKTYYTIMNFLGINPLTIAKDTSKFIAVLRAFNTTSITLNKSWAIELFNKVRAFGYTLTTHTAHNGWSYHVHISGANGKLSNLHIQISKEAYEYLSKLIK